MTEKIQNHFALSKHAKNITSIYLGTSQKNKNIVFNTWSHMQSAQTPPSLGVLGYGKKIDISISRNMKIKSTSTQK